MHERQRVQEAEVGTGTEKLAEVDQGDPVDWVE